MPMFSTCKKIAATLGIALCAATAHADSPWKFEAGISAGSLTPVMVEAGIGYKAALFRKLPFHIDAGFGAGYEYAQAPNKIHQAVNKANDAKYLYPYNYKESLDISSEVRVHLFGFFTQIDIPLHNFMDHDAPKWLWRAGYLVEF